MTMQIAAARLIEYFSPSGITGPIFDKELRVSSRRKRTYVLRSVYIVLLTLLVTITWLSVISIGSSGSAIYQASRMALVGRSIIMTMSWFQFIAAQILAVIMLSNAISSEIHHKTLDVLMTTPITCFQIVTGKLMSALLQLFLLLSISFAVLGVVRVYGGIQWDYVLSTFCVTITGCIFAASLSLLLSIKAKQSYSVIVTFVMLYMISLGLFFLVSFNSGFIGSLNIFAMFHPFVAFIALQVRAMPAAGAFGAVNFLWPLHCLIMLVLSCALIAVSTVMVRKNALRQLAPAGSKRKGKTKIHKRSASALEMKYMVGASIVQDGLGRFSRPMIWKYLGFFGLLAIIVLTNIGFKFDMRMMFLRAFTGLGLWLITTIRTGSMAAISLAREKESRSLAILLTTPLTSRQIVKAKARATMRRNLPLWSLILLNSLLSSISMLVVYYGSAGGSGQMLWQIIRIITSVILVPVYMYFVIASGLYFGTKFKNQSSAVIGFVIFAIGAHILYSVISQIIMMIFMFAFGGFGAGGGGMVISAVITVLPIAMYIVTAVILKRKTIKNLRKCAF